LRTTNQVQAAAVPAAAPKAAPVPYAVPVIAAACVIAIAPPCVLQQKTNAKIIIGNKNTAS
jgi:hypothetical protein